MSALEELWLGKNKIERIDGLGAGATPRLRRLDLQSNRLAAIAGLDALPELSHRHCLGWLALPL